MVNEESKGSRKWDEANDYIEKIGKISPETMRGVIEKWLTYAKSENLTQFTYWRKHLM